MAKYILKSTTAWVGTERERELDFFTDEDFERYEKEGLSDHENEDLQMQAAEDQGFEWYIEKVESED